MNMTIPTPSNANANTHFKRGCCSMSRFECRSILKSESCLSRLSRAADVACFGIKPLKSILTTIVSLCKENYKSRFMRTFQHLILSLYTMNFYIKNTAEVGTRKTMTYWGWIHHHENSMEPPSKVACLRATAAAPHQIPERARSSLRLLGLSGWRRRRG